MAKWPVWASQPGLGDSNHSAQCDLNDCSNDHHGKHNDQKFIVDYAGDAVHLIIRIKVTLKGSLLVAGASYQFIAICFTKHCEL